MDDDPHPEHKLCGYLCTVLTSPSPGPTPLSPCHIISDGHRVFFKASNDVVLHPLASNSDNPEEEEEEEEAGEVEERSVRKKRRVPRGVKKGAGEMKKKKKRKKKTTTTRRVKGIGMVNGSLSVVHQVHSLLANRCLKVAARVLYVVEAGRAGGARVVVLVDVYLPIALWSGWQFPRSGSVAGALFRHLSCDWEKRRLMLVEGGEYFKNAEGRGDGNVWNISDCHVVGCNLNCGVPDPLKKRCFELHEIFKSLPSVTSRENFNSSRVFPVDNACGSGIWDLADDILLNILTALNPKDLVRVAASCKHLRSLAALIMPCMKLKLFPHQRAAVEWMLQRERNASSLLPHPLYMGFSSEDGFSFYVNIVSGEIVTGEPPTIRDIRGGMFCDEPGLGKTITALSLILKTQGMMADPPDGAQVTWCMHNGDQRCGYYELRGDNAGYNFSTLGKKVRGQLLLDEFTTIDDLSLSSPERARLPDTVEQITQSNESSLSKGSKLLSASPSEPVARVVRCTRTLGRIRKNLLNAYEEASIINRKVGENSTKRKRVTWKDEVCGDASADFLVCNETWIQCDACQKWRKLRETAGEATSAWFCSMNTDTAHQSCEEPEEDWDNYESITCLPGFYAKGTSGGTEQNVSFFISVLKEHYLLINTNTKKALTWLAKLSPERLVLMETIGLPGPVVGPGSANGSGDACGFHTIFQAFGLTRKLEKGVSRWFYPQTLDNLALDLPALRIALCKPLDSVRLYLSRATLIVVPSNLVDHWRTQIQRHVKPGQLRICIWTDHRRPSVHSLAWDYDVVITTFNRLSTEWSLSKKGPLMQVHWLRVMLDEGHTLGSSFNLTNKLQMAISLMASSRWLLTGTPTPNTPNSQLSHLQQLLMFLHEEAFGQNQKSWDAGILRPFEAEMEEGYSRLMQLLGRCLISARKADLKAIPPCIKKVTLLDFTEEHARSYNELVVTVRRNILMADWNDPSHVESLLNPKQWKFRSATIRNVRLSCCVAGHIKVQDAGQDIQETMDVFIAKGLDPLSEEYALIKYYLQHGGNCLRCKQWCRLPVVTPCRHLLCLDCVALDDEKCTLSGCGNLYEMQMPENLARPENPNPKWPVPKDLIELQPSYKQDDWDADWQSTSSSKVAYLVQRLKALQEANRNNGYNGDENSGAKTVGEQFCLSRVGNSSTLLQEDSCGNSGSCKMALVKVIIFSQFLEHIHVIAQQLAFAGIKFAGLHSPMHTGNKMKSLATFQHDPTCMVLLMDGSAALGLDLSFVTHVFLMEPIWDRSIEEQVISRAHRMGATRPINVETLAMRGTIEEQMLEFLQDVDERRKLLKEEYVRSEREGARPPRSLHDFAERNYLARLSFVHTSPRA